MWVIAASHPAARTQQYRNLQEEEQVEQEQEDVKPRR